MKYFKPVDPGEIPFTNHGKVLDVLNEISHANCEAVEIDWKALRQSTALNSASSFMNAIKRYNLPFTVALRNDRVFVTKKGE